MKCSFCGNEIRAGTGKIYVKKEGSTVFLCSKKCEKNLLKLRRNPRKTRWTKHHKDFKESEKKVVKQ